MALPSTNARVSIVAWGDRYNYKSGTAMPQVIVLVCVCCKLHRSITKMFSCQQTFYCKAMEELRRQHSVAASLWSIQAAASLAAVEPMASGPHVLWLDVRPSMLEEPYIHCTGHISTNGMITINSALHDKGIFQRCLLQLSKSSKGLNQVVDNICDLLCLPGVGHRKSFIILLNSTMGLHRASLGNYNLQRT